MDIYLIHLDPEPFEILLDPFVDLGDGGLHIGACVLESQDEPPIIHLCVLVTEDDGLGAPQVEGSVGVWCEPGLDDLEPFDVLEWREGLSLLRLFSALE